MNPLADVSPRGAVGLLLRGPVAVLLLVATFQMVLANFARLSPWKGGGFGMFASLDDVRSRRLRYYAVADNGERFALLSAAGDVEYDARVLPTETNFRRVAEALLGLQHPAGFTKLEIELWKTTIRGARVESKRWITYTHRLEQ